MSAARDETTSLLRELRALTREVQALRRELRRHIKKALR
jgi:hypothetical protein